MPPFIKIITILVASVALSGCLTTSIKTKPIERAKLEIERPEPLKLRTVYWKVLEYDQVTYFALDTTNFSNLAKNTEDAQNRLYLQNVIIDKQQQFYENPSQLLND